MRPLWMWQSHKPPASPGKKDLKAHKGKSSMLFHLHLCQSMAPQQQYPGEDVGEPLEHNDSLVPGSPVQDLPLEGSTHESYLVRSVKMKTKTRNPR